MRRIDGVVDALNLTIHPSQFPDVELAALTGGLANGRVDPRLHYRSPLQSARWLRVYERWAPFNNREDCRIIYNKSSKRAAGGSGGDVAVIGLGCGDGSKDVRLLESLQRNGSNLHFVPLDVSASLATRAALAARRIVPAERIHPIVADLGRAADLREWLDVRLPETARRIVTFYGMIPNFEPDEILPRLSALLRPGDQLLFSANLAPGNDLHAAVNSILPQYDNAETRAWLMTLLEEAGEKEGSGELKFRVESGSQAEELRRIVARFHFCADTTLRINEYEFSYPKGSELRLFYSYRYSVQQIRELLERFGIRSVDSWITDNGEEGVFMCGLV